MTNWKLSDEECQKIINAEPAEIKDSSIKRLTGDELKELIAKGRWKKQIKQSGELKE